MAVLTLQRGALQPNSLRQRHRHLKLSVFQKVLLFALAHV
jgi:hypothetical protein